jgi:hypothetical protein
MNWTEVFKTAFGPLIGAVIALISLWAKEVFDRRRDLQAWYEEQYLREGLDRIAAHIMAVKYNLTANPDSVTYIRGNAHFAGRGNHKDSNCPSNPGFHRSNPNAALGS